MFNWNYYDNLKENSHQTGDLHKDLDINSFTEVDLDDYEKEIINLLAIETIKNNSNSILSFQGIKRKLNTHQQIISRSLKRLEKAFHYFQNQISQSDMSLDKFNPEKIGIKTIFGTNITNEEFLNSLKGTWFLDFRYIGWYKGFDFVKLKWLTESQDFEGNASCQSGKIFTETIKLLPEISEKNLIEKNEQFNEKIIKKLINLLPKDKQIYFINQYLTNESNENKFENVA